MFLSNWQTLPWDSKLVHDCTLPRIAGPEASIPKSPKTQGNTQQSQPMKYTNSSKLAKENRNQKRIGNDLSPSEFSLEIVELLESVGCKYWWPRAQKKLDHMNCKNSRYTLKPRKLFSQNRRTPLVNINTIFLISFCSLFSFSFFFFFSLSFHDLHLTQTTMALTHKGTWDQRLIT